MAMEDNIKESTLNAINTLCNWLNILTSPNIEERTGCTFDCCIGNDVPFMIQTLIENEKMHYLFGQEGLEFLRQLYDCLSGYDGEKGFSKTQSWSDIVDFTHKVNVFLKDILKNNNYEGP